MYNKTSAKKAGVFWYARSMKWKSISVAILVLIGVLSGGHVAQATSTDEFTITNYNVEMTLGRDSENRSTLKTTETITADFPESDANHGLEQDFVKEYDGHSTSFQLIAVTDQSGQTLPHHWDDDALRIGDGDGYVHGLHTYEITYTQRDVTKHYADTSKDEFYWDAIGTEWRVPIEQATVQLTIAPELQKAIKTDLQCYQGSQGSGATCTTNSANNRYTAQANDIGSSRGLTIAVGFASGTFAGYKMTPLEAIGNLAMISNFVLGPFIAIAGIIWLALKIRGTNRRHLDGVKETIIPEYVPPKNYSVLEGARIYNGQIAGKGVSAQLIDWAVRHYIEIRQTKEKSFWSAAVYTITCKKAFSSLSENERQLASAIFGHVPAVGDSITTKKMQGRTRTITTQTTSITKSIAKENLYEQVPAFAVWAKRFGIVCLILGILLLNVVFIVLGIVALSMRGKRFLSTEGRQLKQYLEGLKMYIGIAEEERLKMLQSPEGAEKVGNVTDDKGALIKLYEKVLPYAIVFGQEKQWNDRLGKLYEENQSSPDWMVGNTVYNAALFSSFTNSFTSTVSSASSYSSSSGGSGGGGFSGGGGGGGGGGGW